MAKKKNNKAILFFRYIVLAMGIITLIALALFKFIDVLPGEYFLVMTSLLIILSVTFGALALNKHSGKRRMIGTVLSIIYMVILVIAIVYELNTIGFLKKLGFTNYKTENYSVLVLKSSNYKDISEIDKKTMGSLSFKDEGLKKAKDKVLKRISVDFKTYDDVSMLKNDFLDSKFEALLIENSILAILTEDDSKLEKSYEVIYEFSIDVETEDITKGVDITKDSFNIYVSGIDTYGAVSSVSRSDVNMVITVNPKTKKILITSIPRDYYVDLAGKDGKDKLTHAGIYGISTSVGTLEKLLDIKINYYVKVNFTSFVKVIDALGGVSVYSNHNFKTRDGYSFQVGQNNVNGEAALSFVRERKSFSGGDRVRIENQAAMIKAIIDKAVSPAIITKYNSLLKTLGDSFITNLDSEAITEFIKMQINEMPSWDVSNYSLNGHDGSGYTYSYGSQKLYVMIPDNDTVINAQHKIREIMTN